MEIGGRIVSSSLVRKLLAAGEIGEVRRLLTRPYRLRGTVVHGAGRGAASASPPPTSHISTRCCRGRAFTRARPGRRAAYAAALSVGPNPTFHEQALKVEACLLDFEGDLYDRPIEVDFLARLRDIKRFASAAELVRQITDDVQAVRRIHAQECP